MQWVLGKGSNTGLTSSDLKLTQLDPDNQEYGEMLSKRNGAATAFLKADASERIQRAMLRRSRPARREFRSAEWV